MRIALLNLPYDNNYGGNLQRYALMKVLHDMGHSVTHLNLRFDCRLPWYKKPKYYGKRFLSKVLFKRDIKVFFSPKDQYEQNCSITDTFYKKYINHTETIYDPEKLAQYIDYDAFIVGSDQVWRKKIAAKYLPYMFFSHLQNVDKPKIACAVSFGTDTNELNAEEIAYYGNLYKKFDAVSVRESSGLNILDQLAWMHPKAIHLFDPTFMLSKSDYQTIINSSETKPSAGNLFCYILDMTEEKEKVVEDIASEKALTPFYVSLKNNVSIPQWLKAFDDADFIITDSFHGLVFSLIFNKPFKLIKNEFRGNARFDSVIETFKLKDNQEFDWSEISRIIQDNKKRFINFLESALLQ
jgi:hypothetical protein